MKVIMFSFVETVLKKVLIQLYDHIALHTEVFLLPNLMISVSFYYSFYSSQGFIVHAHSQTAGLERSV